MRIHSANAGPLNPQGRYVLYWMIAARRTRWNFALDRAIHWARQLKRPLVVLEALRVGYPWASDRLHGFVLQGMADHQRRFAAAGVLYHPYVEPAPGHGRGLLEALAAEATLVVTDEYPCFFLPRMVSAAAARLPVLVELVDSSGLLPLRAATQAFPTAYAFRRFLQRELPAHLTTRPADDPLVGIDLPATELPPAIAGRWPAAADELLAANPTALAALPIDHSVQPASQAGGERAAAECLRAFVERRLPRYAEGRNEPDEEAASGLSPYLHFGHVAAHQVFAAIERREGWSPERLIAKASGRREGWWGMSPEAEAFLDELVTWRELGYGFAFHRPDYELYESLPEWAQRTLGQHAADPRPRVYTPEQFEAARTHDPLWNAAQTQLVREGRMHNYLRMLWGKKILEWSPTPRAALDVMIELNNKYAVDGRDPNSYSGIFWVLGRFDRPWAPERPIFGAIRYMSSENTARKLRVKQYLRRYAAPASP